MPSPNSADITEEKYQARAVLDSAELPLLPATTKNLSSTSNEGCKVKEEESIAGTETVETHARHNCEVLFVQNQKLEKEKDKLAEGLEQALETVQKQEKEENIPEPKQNIKPSSENQAQTNNDNGGGGVLDCEVPLLFSPLQKEMASIFQLKGHTVWLTIRFDKSTGRIIAVYLGRKSQGTCSGKSIMTSYVWLRKYTNGRRL
jgi:hypothetical protein